MAGGESSFGCSGDKGSLCFYRHSSSLVKELNRSFRVSRWLLIVVVVCVVSFNKLR